MDENVSSGHYQIRLRKGNCELEIAAPDKDFVLNEWERLAPEAFAVIDLPLGNGNGSEKFIQSETKGNGNHADQTRGSKPQTLSEFMKQFKFQSNLDRTLVFGYWCEVKLQQAGFTSEDILVKYREAKEIAPKNIKRDLGTLVSRGFLFQPNQSAESYELTNTGINEVEQNLSN